MNTIKMNNGMEIPAIGIGTYTIAPADARRSVCEALQTGCRLVDTANAYVNERAVGRGLRDAGIAREHDIRLMSWYPLGHGDSGLLKEPVFKKLGEKYGKTPAQVILRWHTQMGFIVIPGSKNAAHIRENIDIFDFALTDDEMKEIAKINKKERYYNRTEAQLAQFAAWQPEYEAE